MSSEAQTWALQQKVGDPVAKLVLASLANHHNPSTGRCFPKFATLMVAAECSKSTVIRKLKFLAEKGWIKIAHRFAEGRQTSNDYILMFDNWAPFKVTAHPSGQGCQPDTAGVSDRHGGECHQADTPIKTKNEKKRSASRISQFSQKGSGCDRLAEPPPEKRDPRVGPMIRNLAKTLSANQRRLS